MTKVKPRKIKKDFPIFKYNKDLVYLDSAATSQRPKQVIEAISNFSRKDNANVDRGLYTLADRAMQKYNNARKIIASFINSKPNEIVFTRNTTESINLLANSIKPLIKKGKRNIVLTEMEHHSNLIPWQRFAKDNKMELRFIKLNKNTFTLDMKDAKEKIDKHTALVAFTHVSNVLGTINPIKKIINLARKNKALTLIDAAQSISHLPINVKELKPDFLAFSSHKMLGPMGIGVLYGKEKLLNELKPFNLGGGMIKSVSFKNATYTNPPEKFEAGTQNISEAMGLAESIKYLRKIGLTSIRKNERKLLAYALKEMKNVPNIEIYNPGLKNSLGIVSFNIKNVHPHDVAELLNRDKIAIRGGHMCAMPLMSILGVKGVCRASFSVFTTKKDIDKLIKSLKKINARFNR